jgi:zinc protease
VVVSDDEEKNFFLKKLNMCVFLESEDSMKPAPTIFKVLFAGVAMTLSSLVCAAPEIHEFKLDNGLTVIVKPDRRAPTAVHMLWLKVGSMDEVDGTSGVAHVLEHMMFKGTDQLAPGEFSKRVAALGGRENAFTSRDYTAYFQQIPSHRLADVMALEASRLARNQWADDEFKREIEVVKEERRMRTDDNPRALLHEQLNAVAFVASPYRRPIVGWMSDLDSMRPDDVRQFYRQWYAPGNAAVVVAGDVDPQQVLAWAQKYYGAVPSRAVSERKPRLEPVQQGLRRVDFKAPAEQAYVSLAFKVPDWHTPGMQTDVLALTMLSAVLDGYPGSRLERALTQGSQRVADSAGASNGLVGRGPQMFVLDGVPAPGKTAAQLEAALRAEVARIAREGVTEAELSRVKAQWMASEVYKLDSVMNQARELGSYWAMDLPLNMAEQWLSQLQTITPAQVQSVAQRYFGDDALTVATLWPQPLAARAPIKPAQGLRH